MIYKPISLNNRRSDINVLCEESLLCLMCIREECISDTSELTFHSHNEPNENNAFDMRQRLSHIKCIVLFYAAIITRCRDPPINRFVIFKIE